MFANADAVTEHTSIETVQVYLDALYRHDHRPNLTEAVLAKQLCWRFGHRCTYSELTEIARQWWKTNRTCG